MMNPHDGLNVPPPVALPERAEVAPPVQENTTFGRFTRRILDTATGFGAYVSNPIYNTLFRRADVAVAAVEGEVAPRTWALFASDMVTNYAYNPVRNYIAAPLYYGFVTAPYNNILVPIRNLFASRVSRHFNDDAVLMNNYDTVVRNIRDRQYAQKAVAGQKSYLKMVAERTEKVLGDANLYEGVRDWDTAEAYTLGHASLYELYAMKQEIISYQYLADSEKENALSVRQLVAEERAISGNYKAQLKRLAPGYEQDMQNNYLPRLADAIVANIGPKKGWLHGFNSSVFDRHQLGDAEGAPERNLEEAKLFARVRVLQFAKNVNTALAKRTGIIARS